MINICIDSPVPNLVDLKRDFLNQLESIKDSVPNFQDFIEKLSGISLPNLLGLPDPLFLGYSNIIQELMEVIDAIKYQADTLTMMNIFKPLASVIGGALKDIIPKIPTLNFSIIDIVSGNIQGLYDAILSALKQGVKLPYLPTNLFESFSNYTKEALLSLKIILVGYKGLLLDTMQGMIKKAMSILEISGSLPTLPKIPSIEELKQMVLAAFPDYESWYELITNVDVNKIISIFGLGAFLLPEINFIPNFSNIEKYLMESLNQISDHYSTLGLTMLVDFVESTLGMLGFSFPLFCIGF